MVANRATHHMFPDFEISKTYHQELTLLSVKNSPNTAYYFHNGRILTTTKNNENISF